MAILLTMTLVPRNALFLAIFTLLTASASVFAQQDAATIGTRLLTDGAIQAALEAIKAAEPQTIEDQDQAAPRSPIPDP